MMVQASVIKFVIVLQIIRLTKLRDLFFAIIVKTMNACYLHILFSKYFLLRITSNNNMEQKRVQKGKI